MLRKQNKDYESGFFDEVAKSGHYESNSESLYSLLFQIIRKHSLSLNGRALECGCGTGAFGRRFLQQFGELEGITGVDISRKMVEVCQSQNIPRYQAVIGDLEDPSLFFANQFSMVICPFILHHFPTIDFVIQNISRWLNEGGLLVLVEPNGSSPVNRMSKTARWLVEKIMGPKWIMEKGLATPNETDHRVSAYKRHLHTNGFDILTLKTFTIAHRTEDRWTWAGMISSARQALTWLSDRIFAGTSCSGSTLIIIARKMAGNQHANVNA